MITSQAFAGKRYAVLGLARSGLSVVESLLASGAHVMAWDNRNEPRETVEGRVELADPVSADISGYEAVVVSPGVPLNASRSGASQSVPGPNASACARA